VCVRGVALTGDKDRRRRVIFLGLLLLALLVALFPTQAAVASVHSWELSSYKG
jgi:hypothetical protein